MISARKTAALGCMAAAALASPWSFAQESGWYGGVSLGRTAATIDQDSITRGLAGQGLATSDFSERDRDVGYKLFGGYQLNRNFGIEAGWFDVGEMGYTATTTPAGTLRGDVRVRGLNLDLVGTLPLTERLSLLGRVGVAHARTKGSFAATGAVTNPYGSTSTSDRDTGIKFGAGLAWRLADAWELRGEIERLRINDSVGNRGHIDMLSVGLVYRFGGSPAPRVATVARVEPAPMPVVVQAAPPPPVAVAPPLPAPAPPRVTTVHFSADALFDFDKSTLRPQGARELDELASQLRSTQYERVRIVGHTDRLGSEAYNLALSQRRAEAVSAYLVRAGVPAASISSTGAGESSPVTALTDCRGSKPTPALVACLQPDRRVEAEVDARRSSAP